MEGVYEGRRRSTAEYHRREITAAKVLHNHPKWRVVVDDWVGGKAPELNVVFWVDKVGNAVLIVRVHDFSIW